MRYPFLTPFKKGSFPVALGFALCFALSYFDLNWLEARLYDFRVQNSLSPPPSQEIILVTWDDRTLRQLDTEFPGGLDQHAQLLEKLSRSRPAGIGYLVDLRAAGEVSGEAQGTHAAARFYSAARTLLSNSTPFLLGSSLDVTGETSPPYPLSTLPHAVVVTHRDGNVFAEDKVTRRALTRIDGVPTFSLRFAQELNRVSSSFSPRGSYQAPEANSEFFFFRYNLRPDRPSYTRVSVGEILRDDFDPISLNDKVILVGTVSREDVEDFSLTPYSRNPILVPKLAIQANILESILLNNGIRQLPFSINLTIATLTTALVIGWVILSSPFSGLLATVVLGLSFILVTHFIFSLSGVWIRTAEPLTGMLLSYYVLVPYRLIREYKARWDYQRRNDILIQVEELKRNFLSLVTHDLKTPVARIQGLAELLLRRSEQRFSETEKENLRHISAAAEELDRFINSLLELTRIDSGKFELAVVSRDINQIIENSVQAFSAIAHEKQITLATELEPLFPIQLDPMLVTKVLRNLIDNGIKYTPAGGSIRISSQELSRPIGTELVPGVQISIKDTGIGMSNTEKAQLFNRFHRIKNDHTSRIPGTGLGLYLSRYFMEAHGGTIEVESVENEGSCFKIWLPEVSLSLTSQKTNSGLKTQIFQKPPPLQQEMNR